MENSQHFRAGAPVIFRADKRSAHPGRRARDVRPEPFGEGYVYCVDKFWRVAENRGDRVLLQTRRGKVREVEISDHRLRPASWWELLFYKNRFPKNDTASPKGPLPA